MTFPALLCGACLALPGAIAAPETPRADAAGEDSLAQEAGPYALVERICANGAAHDADERRSLSSALAAHGAEALPVVFAALTGRDGAPSVGPKGSLSHQARALLLEAVGGWPPARTVESLGTELGPTPTLDERVAALDVCAALGSADALPFLLEVLSGMTPAHLGHPLVAEPATAAFAALLRRDTRTWSRIGSLAEATAPHVLLPAARAAGELGHARGLALLEGLLELSPALDLAVLEALGKLRTWDPAHDPGRCAMLVGYGLGAREPEARRQAVIALGRMRADDFAPELVQLLEDPDARVARGALWALREISGLGWSHDRPRWEGWLEAEETWHAMRRPLLLERLHGTDPVQATDALRELGLHRVYRRELGEELSFALEHDNGAVVVAACAALARLEDTGSVSALAACLGDRRRRVREAAARSLQSLTGLELPAREEAWRSALDG